MTKKPMTRKPQPATLEDAIALSATAHAGQLDKIGEPYILHPLRVMLGLNDPMALMAAVLHDVVEGTAIKLADLKKAGFDDEVLAAVDCLTKREGELYEDYLARVKPNAIALRVKSADLRDNGSPDRLVAPPR